MSIELYPSPWRGALEGLLRGVHNDLLIAAPFIKKGEAERASDILADSRRGARVRLQVLTDVRTDSVLGGSLDIDALKVFSLATNQASVVNLPRLHAKAYVADDQFAIIGSANLTSAGLDFNYEYSVGIRDSRIVRRIRQDFEAYARIGNVLDPQAIGGLSEVARSLRAEYQELHRAAGAGARRRFNRKLRQANMEFLRSQVGVRSANNLFAEAITYLLSSKPMSTKELHPRIRALLPDLCDDAVELVINGERFGKRWKHAVRNAQQYLKRSGAIRFDGARWRVAAK